jgi:hypothetical protein
MFKRTALFVSLAILLASCGTSPKRTAALSSFKPPANCNDTNVLSALPQDLTNAVYIPTEWQPAAGTDLAAILDGGGIACTYGVQQAEIGATVSWVKDVKGLFNSRVAEWKAAGYEEQSIPGVSADKIFIISDAAMNARDIHSWSANILVKGNWIQVSASYIYKSADSASLVNAAITSLRS